VLLGVAEGRSSLLCVVCPPELAGWDHELPLPEVDQLDWAAAAAAAARARRWAAVRS
jgi:hypothetical protein